MIRSPCASGFEDVSTCGCAGFGSSLVFGVLVRLRVYVYDVGSFMVEGFGTMNNIRHHKTGYTVKSPASPNPSKLHNHLQPYLQDLGFTDSTAPHSRLLN